jgi:hypothetical protein
MPASSRIMSQPQTAQKAPEADSTNKKTGIVTWVLVVGSFLFPEMFRSMTRMGLVGGIERGKVIGNALCRMPPVWIAATCFGVGTFCLAWLWWTMKHSYVWLGAKLLLHLLQVLR